MKPILLLDGNSLLNRAHFGLGVYTRLTAPDGRPTAAVYSFMNSLLGWLQEYQPQAVFVAWDVAKKTFRHDLYPDYKGGRPPMDDDLRQQFPIAKDLLSKMGIANFGLEEYEADDLIATAAEKASQIAAPVIIISGDRDLYQLVKPGVSVVRPTTRAGKPVQLFVDQASFVDHYGFQPEHFVDYRALVGDSSDGLPGVKGIGDKTATKLIQEFVDLDQIYQNLDKLTPGQRKKLEQDREMAYKTKELSRLVKDLDLDLGPSDLSFNLQLNPELATELEALGLRSILAKLVELVPSNEFDVGLLEPQMLETQNQTERVLASFSELLSSLKKLDNKELLIVAGDQLAENSNAQDNSAFVELELTSMLAEADSSQKEQLSFYLKDNQVYRSSYGKFSQAELHDLAKLVDRLYVYDAKSILRRLGFSCPELKIFDFKIAAYLLAEGREEKRDLADLLKAQRLDPSQMPASAFQLGALQADQLASKEMTSLAYDLEFPLAELLARMELAGIQVDRRALDQLAAELQTEVAELERQIYELAGSEFNLNSSQQLAKVLYHDLGLPVGKKTKSGYGSTGVDELNRLAESHQIVPLVLEYRQLAKLLQGFVLSLDKYIEADQRIHTHYNQVLTATGRLSSAEPNLQNIPIRSAKGRELRRVFTAGPGKLLVSADYSQIELRLLAYLSGDHNLKEAFVEHHDIHSTTAKSLFPDHEEIGKRERSIAKTVNFSIVYGISAYSLAVDLRTSLAEAKHYIDSYHASFPEVQPWLDAQVSQAELDGYVKTMLGRRRALPELKAKNYNQRQYAVRQAMNAPVQGSAADLIKLAMLKVDRAIREKGLKARILLQIHDELLLEVDLDQVDEVAELLKLEMVNSYDIGLPLEVSLDQGENWYQL